MSTNNLNTYNAHKAYGWLIYNSGLNAPKYMALNHLYVEAAKKMGISLQLIGNTQIHSMIKNGNAKIHVAVSTSQPDFILFLDKDIRLAQQLETLGYRLFNSSEVIKNCDDKILTFQKLADSGIAMPKTIFSPMLFDGIGKMDATFISFIEDEINYPMVVKEAFGSFGAQVYLIHNHKQLMAIQNKLLYTPHLYQSFISSSIGQDVRIYVVGGEVVSSMYRYSAMDFRANISNGGSMKAYTPNEAFCKMAIDASNLLGADFTGVDLLFGPDDEPILCEVNSNAHIKNILDCTGVNVAEFIFKHILEVISHA